METSRDKSICIGFGSQEEYNEMVQNPKAFRSHLEEWHERHPELFPKGFSRGFVLHEKRKSKKRGLWLRRVQVKATGRTFSVRPSLVMPYMTGFTDDVEKALFLRHYQVPFHALTYVFGSNDMRWYRMETALGRFSVVGTSIKKPELLPEHLAADEKHVKWDGAKAFVPTVAANGLILGVGFTEQADQVSLTTSYGVFAKEARELKADYKPLSVCTDGWDATQRAFKALFPSITVVLCFLHSVLKISRRCLRHPLSFELLSKAWEVFHSRSKGQFSQRVRRLREWAEKNLQDSPGILGQVRKLINRKAEFLKAFNHPDAYRTSNEVDRRHDYLDRRLYAMRSLHGLDSSTELSLRAFAITFNFHPFSSRVKSDSPDRISPFHDLNGFQYHSNWLHNLLIAASMGGRRL